MRATGDGSPFQSFSDRLKDAVAAKKEPFDGKCQICSSTNANVSRRVAFRYLDERLVSSYEGVQPGVVGGRLVVGASSEKWDEAAFPLLFCADCHAKFTREWSRASWINTGKSLVSALLFIPVAVALLVFSFLVPILTLPAAILVFAMIVRNFTRKKADPFIIDHLANLRIVSEAISVTDEYIIDVHAPRAFNVEGAAKQVTAPEASEVIRQVTEG